MSSILKELNGLARDIGAPVDGANISEQVAALKGHMASDTMPYSKVTGKPKINNVTVDGNLTPTDPPVPISALPTIQGETIIDYNPSTTPAVEPEKMYTKYRKEGF